MKRKDKFHYFIHRVLYLIKLLKDLKIRLLLIGICISILNAILPYLTMLNTQVIINFIQLGTPFVIIRNKLVIFFCVRNNINYKFMFV